MHLDKNISDLLLKDDFSEEELTVIDEYFSNNLEIVFSCEIDLIKKIVGILRCQLFYSEFIASLNNFLLFEIIDIECCFDIDKIDYYHKLIEVCESLDHNSNRIKLAIADYYFKKDNEKALKYYHLVFDSDFDIYDEGYYYSLERFLEINNGNPKSYLINMIVNAEKFKKDASEDLIKLYLYLLSKMDINEKGYFKTLNNAIKFARKLISLKQSYAFVYETDNERNYLELISIKMKYFILKGKYKTAYSYYDKLTNLIRLTNLTRFYHVREYLYELLLSKLAIKYENINLILNKKQIHYTLKDEVDNIDDKLKKIITLQNKKGLSIDFYIDDIKGRKVRLLPIIPIINTAKPINMHITRRNNIIYFKRVF